MDASQPQPVRFGDRVAHGSVNFGLAGMRDHRVDQLHGFVAQHAGRLAMGIATLIAGSLYASHGGQSYFAMAVIAVLALFASLQLNRVWAGQELIGKARETASDVSEQVRG